MDDLDRLNDRLLDNVRSGFPHLLDRAFQLGDISEHLVPYRLNRRELGFDSVRQYELALMRLAAGERGYLRVESAVQEAFRRALTSPEPDSALLRDRARAPVSLALDGTVRLESVPALAPTSAEIPIPVAPPAPIQPPAPPIAPPGPPLPPPPGTVPVIEVAPVPPPPAPIEPPTSFGFDTPEWATDMPLDSAPVAPLPAPPVPTGLGATPMTQRPFVSGPVEPRPAPTVIGGPCRYCAQPLPGGRAVTFCPHCGQNVTVRLCPACSTELEVGWHYCITCGRAMDEAALDSAPR